jgi:glycosyltransferase involved in cell wall biosynthesis
MKFSVIISNYNGAAYVREAVDSVLAQKRPADEFIVVDDGSTDDSLAVLDRHYGKDSRVKIIAQENQGQTAAFATGYENSTGDILCLLDPDDRYKPHYLSELEAHYRQRPHVDLTFCRFEPFGLEPFNSNDEYVWLSPPTDYDYGITALMSYFGKIHWVGNVTSTMSLRRRMMRVLNLREVANAFFCMDTADYPIAVGTSLLKGRAYHLHQELVEYRHHEKNWTHAVRRQRGFAYSVRFSEVVRRNFYRARSFISEEMSQLLPDEAKTIPNPLASHLMAYARLSAMIKLRKQHLAFVKEG